MIYMGLERKVEAREFVQLYNIDNWYKCTISCFNTDAVGMPKDWVMRA